jgi:hypothetical protein
MKGVAVAGLFSIVLLVFCGIVWANQPIVPPVQYVQFCEAKKVSGTGIVDASTSIVDKRIALEYYNTMAGNGDIELDQEQVYSQNADKLKRNVTSINGGNESNLNLFEKTKTIYSGKTPLTGEKYLHSKEFYGGIGANVQEMFSVTEMEKEGTSFFASTAPYNPVTPCDPTTMFCTGDYPDYYREYYPQYFPPSTTPETFIKDLKNAGRDQTKVAELMGSNPSHVIGIDTKNTFNGTWGTDASWHKIFYNDIKSHESYTGKYEVEKSLKFHENPVPENLQTECADIDC